MLNAISVRAIVPLVGTFGKNLRALRLRSDFRYATDLAEKLQIDPSIVSRWETGKTGLPEGPTLLRLAKILGASIDELLDGEDDKYDAIAKASLIRRAEALLKSARKRNDLLAARPLPLEVHQLIATIEGLPLDDRPYAWGFVLDAAESLVSALQRRDVRPLAAGSRAGRRTVTPRTSP
jgi:transcriptional regulator with XRE-family HTH domain